MYANQFIVSLSESGNCGGIKTNPKSLLTPLLMRKGPGSIVCQDLLLSLMMRSTNLQPEKTARDQISLTTAMRLTGECVGMRLIDKMQFLLLRKKCPFHERKRLQG